MNKVIYSVIIVLSLVTGALAQGQGQPQGQTNNVNVFVVVTPTTYQLDLKAIEGETPITNFVIKPESVVQVKQSDNLVVVTQPINQIVESVKVQDQTGVIKELESLGNNVYSLTGIPVGAYILDVIVDLGSNKKGAYETILVILAQGQQPVNPTQIINKVKQITDVQIIFEDPPPIKCQPGYELRDGKCELKYCDENTPEGQLCEDPGDYDTCEPGYIDKGNGCEPRPRCTDDWRTCPPCPPGIEGGWCADEDERGDFDCGDEGMENDPRCIDGEPDPCYLNPWARGCYGNTDPELEPEPIEDEFNPEYVPEVPDEGDQDTGEDNGNGDNGDSGESGDNDNSDNRNGDESQPDQDPPGGFFD